MVLTVNMEIKLVAYPMAKNGRAGDALNLALWGSTFGGLFSAFALLFLAPQLAKLVNYIASPEMFAICLFGFKLTGCDNRLNYTQKPQACYGLYADYYWYEIADVICIGDNETLYYCCPQGCGDVVAKTRLAVEEMYKLYKARKLAAPAKDTAAL